MSLTVPSLTTSRLSGSSVAGRGLRRMLAQAVRIVRAIGHRREVTRLLELDARALKDIGLVRNDVLGALSVPLDADPSLVLRLQALDNHARMRARAHAAQRMRG